jgi:hypothetical protein
MNEQMQMAGGQPGLGDIVARIDEIGQMVAEIHQAVVGGQQGGADDEEALRQEALARLAAQQG